MGLRWSAGRDSATVRQKALDQSMGMVFDGMEGMEDAAKTKRQEALAIQDHTRKLKEAGYDVTEEQVANNLKPEASGFAKFFGAKDPEMTDLYGKRTAEYDQKVKDAADDKKFKREDRNLDREYKESQIFKNYNGKGTVGKDGLAVGGKMPKENEFKAAGFSKRARQAEADLANLPADMGTGTFAGLNDYLPNAMKPEGRKLYEQAKDNFISANLRKESGAAIGAEEREAEDKKYFPQAGDTSAVIAQKKRAREQAMLNLEGEGANALARIGNAEAAPEVMASNRVAPLNKAQAADPVVIKQQLKTMSREEKIRLLQGGR